MNLSSEHDYSSFISIMSQIEQKRMSQKRGSNRMKKYKVYSERNTSIEYLNLDDALKEYEDLKDWEMSNEVDEDSYVELIVSQNDFEDSETLRRATIIVDDERMAISTPRSEGFDFDYWAKWKDAI